MSSPPLSTCSTWPLCEAVLQTRKALTGDLGRQGEAGADTILPLLWLRWSSHDGRPVEEGFVLLMTDTSPDAGPLVVARAQTDQAAENGRNLPADLEPAPSGCVDNAEIEIS